MMNTTINNGLKPFYTYIKCNSHYIRSHEPLCMGSFPSGQEQVKPLGLVREGMQSTQPAFLHGESPVVDKNMFQQ